MYWLTEISWSEQVGTALFMIKHEGTLYKEVFPGKIEAHLSVTVKVRGSNSKWRAT